MNKTTNLRTILNYTKVAVENNRITAFSNNYECPKRLLSLPKNVKRTSVQVPRMYVI